MISRKLSTLFFYSSMIFQKKAIPAAGACGGIGQSIMFIDEAR